MEPLTVNSLIRAEDIELAANPLQIVLPSAVRSTIARCHDYVNDEIARDRPIYGITTGYGALVNHIASHDSDERARGLIDFLTVGQGDPLAPAVARGMLLVRLIALSRGQSGISLPSIEALASFLETPLAPVVPEYGSVGASGDLIPLAHAVQALTGRSEVFLSERRIPADEGLRQAGLTPLVLTGRDSLALVNGTALTGAASALAVSQAKRSTIASLYLTAGLAELLGAGPSFADINLAASSGHAAVSWAAERLRDLLCAGRVASGRPLQEVYSLRCTPQLVGAAVSALTWANGAIQDDLNGVSDNPLFFPDLDKVAHGGNFFGQTLAFATDLIANVTTQLGNLAERQLDLLVDPRRNGGLPALLTSEPGRRHGLTGLQISATSLIAAMRRDCTPAGMQSIATNLHNQDIVPFGNQAALTALRQTKRLRVIQGMLGLALRQAYFLRGHDPAASGGQDLLAVLSTIDPIVEDRPLDSDARHAADALDTLTADAACDLARGII
ncbi:aromatic amino acid ammonia-lyase [Kitasatospora sp. NPDC085895]|uniref:HAL/PAL/TAL family ammonia-lyase n=1 Tax=Kitasatospora sp. NPDC085895 TaxID=3155057 RepID=UPI00344EFFA1